MAGKIFYCSIDPVADFPAIVPNRSSRKAFSKDTKARNGSKSAQFGDFQGKCTIGWN
jgi:hypothetical protein